MSKIDKIGKFVKSFSDRAIGIAIVFNTIANIALAICLVN